MLKTLLCLAVFASVFWFSQSALARLLAELSYKKEALLGSLARRLEDLSISVVKRRLWTLWLTVALGMGFGSVLLFETIPSLLAGLSVGFLIPWTWVSHLEKRMEEAFASQLDYSLDLVAGALRSGMSLTQALEVVSREGQEPGVRYWREAVKEMKLGMPPDEAVGHLAARFGGRPTARDLELFSTAIFVHRSVGGNLAETASRLSDTLRERARLRAQVSALTAQGRMSGWVVGLLPVGILAALQVLDPALIRPLFNTSTGWGILGAGMALELVGAFFIARIVAIEL